jgi:RimJ/RimL family protein N-acetyltransferase
VFDLRVAEKERGKGIGTGALRWLTSYIFENLPAARRIEGYTRIDNIAMRKTFRTVGYIKEAHHRKSWNSAGGTWYDAIGYCMLREDWESGEITPLMWDDEEHLGLHHP